jgi:arylsulfatase A-like enzyme
MFHPPTRSRYRAALFLSAGLMPFFLAYPIYGLAVQLHKQVALPRLIGWLEAVALVGLVLAAGAAAVMAGLSAAPRWARAGRLLAFAGVAASLTATGLAVFFNQLRLAPPAVLLAALAAWGVLVTAFWRKDASEQALTLRALAIAGLAGLAAVFAAVPYVAAAALADRPRNPAALTPPASPAVAARAPRRIVLVTFDELRARSTSLGDPARDLTPALATLAKEATVFSACHSAGDQTSISMPTVLSGLRPSDVFGDVDNQMAYLRDGAISGVAAYLKPAGYRTTYSTMLVSPQSFGMRSEYDDGWAVGTFVENAFNGVGFLPLAETLDHVTPNRFKARRVSAMPYDVHPIYSVVEQGLAMYNEAPERSFLWVHMGLPHHPYYLIPRADLNKTIKPHQYKRVHPFLNGHRDDPGFYQDAYEGYVRYSDAMFGRLVDGLRASPHWEDTLLIVTADHGTLLDPANRSPYALGKVHEDITHVPLLIRAPGQARPGRVDVAVRHEDLVPTIVSQVYETVPPGFQGASLLAADLPPDRIGYSWALRPTSPFDPSRAQSVAAYQGTRKLTVSYPGETLWLTDWKADPAGRRDLRAAHPDQAAALHRWLEQELLPH